MDDNYINVKVNFENVKKKRGWIKWGALAVSLCIVIGSVLGFIYYKAEHPWPTLKVPVVNESSEEIAEIPHWEDMEIYQQYHEIELDGVSYTARSGEIPADRIGEYLGTVTARGWDEYADIAGENPERFIQAEVYAITDISTNCALAIQYEGTDTWYASVDSSYRPETLGQFIDDLNMNEEVKFGYVYYEYPTPSGEYSTIRFENVDSNIIWELLLSETEAENTYNDLQIEPKRILGISVDIPILGYKNISLSVREDGYIITNILDTGKMFYVGEKNTQAFVEYVLEECDGYEIIYVYDDLEPIPE